MVSGLLSPLSSRTLGCLSACLLLFPVAERCQRGDLLVDLEGFHLIAVTGRECSVVLVLKSCRTVTFLEHSEKVCAPLACLGVRAIRWAIRQLRFEGATISGLARQLGTTWNTVWSHIKPCLQAASDDPTRLAGVRVPRVDERRVAPPRPTPPGPT
mgnify:FL=1